MYRSGMRRRTTINVDIELIREAAQALGTEGITATIRAALSEVIQVRRTALADLRPALYLDDLDAMRAHRFSA